MKAPSFDPDAVAPEVLDPRAIRHIGIDVGTTNTSLCYTRYNPGRSEFDLPTAARLGDDNAFLRSALLLDANGAPLAYGDDVYRHPDYHRSADVAQEEFKLRLGDDPIAEHLVALLVAEAARKACRHLQLDTFAPDKAVTNVGVPAEWARSHYHRAEAMMRAVDAAGLPNVGIVPEPVAAMLYHARAGDIVFDQHPQFWLVIDMGGGTTDVAVVETRPGPVPPVVRHTFGRIYGGRDFDHLFLEKVLLPRTYPAGVEPTQEAMPGLVRAARQFKERFADRLAQGHDRVRAGVDSAGRRQSIELTREEFESAAMAGPLIERFAHLLREGFRDVGLPLGDIDRVILTGGSARWYFVRQTADRFFGRNICLRSANPELTIAQGLALARTGFAMPMQATVASPLTSSPPLSPASPSTDADKIELTSVTTQPLDLQACRTEAKQTVIKMAALAGGVALVLSPIPGVSQIPLTSIEAKMVHSVATIYGYQLDERQLVAVVGALLAGGTVAKIAVMEMATFVPVVGTIVKTTVGGGAALAFGRLAIEYFEKRRRAEQGEAV